MVVAEKKNLGGSENVTGAIANILGNNFILQIIQIIITSFVRSRLEDSTRYTNISGTWNGLYDIY